MTLTQQVDSSSAVTAGAGNDANVDCCADKRCSRTIVALPDSVLRLS